MIVDILVGAVLLISAIISFIRGLIREVLTIFGVVGGLLCAYFFGDNASRYIEGIITPDPSEFEFEEAPTKIFDLIPYSTAADILAYGAVFIAVVGILSVISHFMAESLKKVGLGALDRSLGVVFGLLRGVLVLGLLYLPVHLLIKEETKDRWFTGSRTHVYLEKTSDIISNLFPSAEEEEEESTEEEKYKTITDEFGTRTIIEDLKVLKEDAQEKSEAAFEEIENKARDASGYNENFRDEMNRLFQVEGSDPNATNTNE